MERLKRAKETLMSCVETQMGNLQNTDTHELGEAIDMIKDLEEAIYYCTITKAMEENEKEEKKIERHYYTPYLTTMQQQYPMNWDRDMDYDMGRMYYPQSRDSQGRFTSNQGGGNSNSGRRNYQEMEREREYYGGNTYAQSGNNSGSSNGRRSYTEYEFPTEWRDTREGRSPLSRKTYMESKEMHKDKASKIKDLENYMKELSDDVIDMIEDASPEEKQLLEKKISSLATKISSLNTSDAKN